MTARPPWRLSIHEALPSTSDLCRERAEAGEPEGLAVLARRQTAGRGTHGRAWLSPPGNLYMSVLLRPGGPIGEAPRHSLLAAVALADALAPLLPEPAGLRLKWPNDLLLEGGKLAGLLAESGATSAGRIDWLVLGMGVNLAAAPQVPGRRTACVGLAAPAPEVFAADVLARLADWRTRDFEDVRAAWLARGPALGAPVDLRLGAATRHGRFAGLAADGSLLLETGDRVSAFAAGET